jgi:hypothetical protein
MFWGSRLTPPFLVYRTSPPEAPVIDWLLTVGYFSVAVILARRFAWEIAGSDWEYAHIDGEDILFGLIFGGALALIWPVSLPVYVVYRLAQTDRGFSVATRLVFSMPRDVRKRDEIRRQEDEMRDREREIRRMERELGIKP